MTIGPIEESFAMMNRYGLHYPSSDAERVDMLTYEWQKLNGQVSVGVDGRFAESEKETKVGFRGKCKEQSNAKCGKLQVMRITGQVKEKVTAIKREKKNLDLLGHKFDDVDASSDTITSARTNANRQANK